MPTPHQKASSIANTQGKWGTVATLIGAPLGFGLLGYFQGVALEYWHPTGIAIASLTVVATTAAVIFILRRRQAATSNGGQLLYEFRRPLGFGYHFTGIAAALYSAYVVIGALLGRPDALQSDVELKFTALMTSVAYLLCTFREKLDPTAIEFRENGVVQRALKLTTFDSLRGFRWGTVYTNDLFLLQDGTFLQIEIPPAHRRSVQAIIGDKLEETPDWGHSK